MLKLSPPAGVMPAEVGYNMMQPIVCATHREFGPVLCCPFPGCPQGLPQEQEWVFVRPPYSGGQAFQRVAWDLGPGKTTWSWTDTQSLYLWIPRMFWREAYRTGLMPTVQPGQPAYHYTSLDGLLGMLGSSELWLSDYGYLNDADELRHGLVRAQQTFSDVAKARPESRQVLQAYAHPDFSQHRVFIASFSTEGDSLSQWRAYGPVAVGFELGGLGFGYANSTRCEPVVYDLGSQDEMLRMFAHLHASSWEHEGASEKRRLRALYTETDRLLDVIAFFKNSGFADERELRMVHTEIPRLSKAFDLEPAPQRFRAAGGLIVPYVATRDIHRDPPERLPIREVVVGPSAKAVELVSGVERALRFHGYDVPVRLSGVTYRP